MPKIGVFLFHKKKTVSMEKNIADAMVKMKRGEYRELGYSTRMMSAETLPAPKAPKKRGRPKKVKNETVEA